MSEGRLTTPPESPGSATSLRAQNLHRVLDVLRDVPEESVTQAELTRITGLAAGTVSSIVRELASRSVVDTVAGSGRRGTKVRLGRGAGLVAGVDFGHSHLGVAVGDMTGRIIARRRELLEPEHDSVGGLTRATALLERALGDIGAGMDELRNIGVGLPAPLVDDVVMSSAILPGWVGVNARKAMAEAFGRDVLVDNDANLGTLAEHRHGAGRGHADLVFVKVSSGVGAGIIIDGTLFRGANGSSGEVGHLTLDEQGPLCRCGSRGCLEAYASSGTMLEMMSTQLPGATVEEVIEAARGGNFAAIRAFEDAGLHLGWGLAALVNLVNPSLVVVGGDMGHAGDLLLDSARSAMRRHVLSGTGATPVVPAALGDQASVIGALLLAIDATDLLDVAEC